MAVSTRLGPGVTTKTPSTAALRTWALANGIKVADRGRISADVLDAWKSAHSSGRGTGPTKIGSAKAKPVAKARRAAKQIPPAAATYESAPGDTEQDSRVSKAEVLYETLEQRVRALEERLSEDKPATAAKKRGLFRRPS
jgi:hypothetical protein